MRSALSWLNPVLARELTERMRGPRAMVMLSGYLGVLGLVLVLVYRTKTDAANSRFGGSPVVELATTGQGIFEFTLLFTMLLVLFLVPGFTAGSVVGERERQTLMPMQVSLLRPRSIILGKLGASVVFTLLLVLATLPLLTVAYLIGGVTFPEIVKGLAMVMFTAVGVAAISLACSTFMRRVQTATVVSYGLVLLLCGGTLAAFGVALELGRTPGSGSDNPPLILLAPNPVVALADATTEEPEAFGGEFGFGSFDGYGGGDGPLTGIREFVTPDDSFRIVEQGPGVLLNGVLLESDGVVGVVGADAGGVRGRGVLPLWAQNVLIVGALAVLSVILSSVRLRTPAKTER